MPRLKSRMCQIKFMDSFTKQSPENHFLKKYIHSFFEIKFTNKNFDYLPAFPNASITLGFFINGGFDVLNKGQVGLKEKFLFSKIARHTTWVKPIGKRIELLGVHFKPNAISLFTDKSLSNLPKQIDPGIIFKGDLNQLLKDFIQQNSTNTRFKLLEKYLLASVRHQPNDRLNKACKIILHQNGNLKVLDISKQLGVSTRTIRNDFTNNIGCSPKHLSRVIRFHATLNKILSSLSQNQSLDFAFEHGYFDQAHFINDFKYFSGYTPKHFFKENPSFRFFQF